MLVKEKHLTSIWYEKIQDKIKIIDAASKFFNILRKNRKKVLKEILKETENIPKDIPHPSFKGPF